MAERRTYVLAICCLSQLVVSLDTTILNLALPSIQDDFRTDVAGLQWVVNAYAIVLASLLLLGGATGDRLGRRRVFQAGLTIFTTGSVLCALAPGLDWLIAFRIVQAVGGSMLNPVAMSIITNTFTDPKQRARAIGVWGGVTGISMAAGPILGGTLVAATSWRSVFWINLPIGLLAIVLAARYLPDSRASKPRRLDPAGQLLVITVLGPLTYAIIEGGNHGWTAPLILTAFAVSACALTGLIFCELRHPQPLIELRFLRSASFSGAVVIAVAAFAAFTGFLFLNTLYLQNERGLSPLRAGLFLLPMAAATLISSPLSGWLTGNHGPRLPFVLAGCAISASGSILVIFPPDDVLLIGSYLLFGTGFGLVNTPITNSAVSGMPRAQAGVASALATTGRRVGAGLGVAVVGAALAADARSTAWWIIAGCGGGIVLLGLLTAEPRPGRVSGKLGR